MGKPQAPQAPSPVTVSNAQTGSNISTAIANAYIGNANTVGPQGSTTFSEGPSHIVGVHNDDGTNTTYAVPTFTQTNTLSPDEQTKLNQTNQLGIGLNNIGIQQTSKIGNLLNTPFDPTAIAPAQVKSLSGGQTFTGSAAAPNATSLTAAQVGAGGPIQANYGPNDYSQDRQRVEDALYARVNPQLDRDRNQLENKLVNQGLVRGTTAFNNAMDEANRQANDARMQVVAQGGQEQSRLQDLARNQGLFANQAQQQGFDENLQRTNTNNTNNLQFGNFNADQLSKQFTNQNAAADFNNANTQRAFDNQQTAGAFQNNARQAAIQESLQQRNQPINEITALMNGGQVQIPQFQQYNAPTIANTDVAGNVYNSAALQQKQYETQVGAQNALIGGLAGLGGAGLYGLARK